MKNFLNKEKLQKTLNGALQKAKTKINLQQNRANSIHYAESGDDHFVIEHDPMIDSHHQYSNPYLSAV